MSRAHKGLERVKQEGGWTKVAADTKGGAPHDSRSHWAAFESFCEAFHGPRD